MTLLPYQKITYKTKLDEYEVVTRLNGIVKPRKLSWFNFFFSHTSSRKPYEGEVTPQQFIIRKITYSYYRASLPPAGLQIKGTIHRNVDGTTIYVTMAPSARSCIEILLLCSMLFLLFMPFILPSGNFEFNASELWLFILFPLLGLGFWVIKFLIVRRNSKKELVELWEAQIVNN